MHRWKNLFVLALICLAGLAWVERAQGCSTPVPTNTCQGCPCQFSSAMSPPMTGGGDSGGGSSVGGDANGGSGDGVSSDPGKIQCVRAPCGTGGAAGDNPALPVPGGIRCVRAPCEVSAGGGAPAGGGCKSCGSLGVPKLSVWGLEVFVLDTPIWLNTPKGPAFHFELAFDSLDGRSRTNMAWATGYRWQQTYACAIETAGSVRTLRVGGNRCYTFTPDGHGGYTESQSASVAGWGGRYTMVDSGSDVLIYVREGGGYRFEPDGSGTRYRLAAVFDAVGQQLTLGYATNRLTTVTTAGSNVFAFSYSATGYLTNVLDTANGRSAVLSYSNDLLVAVSDMVGQTFKYGYDAAGNLVSLGRPNLSGGYDVTTLGYTGSPSSHYQVTVTQPEGGQQTYAWGGERISTVEEHNPLGGVTEKTPDWNYTWGQPIVEEVDPLGRTTSYVYFDLTGNSAVDGKLKKQVDPDGTSAEYSYDGYGNVTGLIRRDSQAAIVSTETNVYVYFTGLRRAQSMEHWTLDAAGNALSHRLVGYNRDARGTTNDWDDVVTLAFTREWYGINATDYTGRRYTYAANGLPVLEESLVGPGTNDFRVVASNAYNVAGQLVARTDAGSNTLYYGYDAANRLATETGWLTRGTPGTNDDVALVVRHGYDTLNQETNLVYPDGFSESWNYAVCGCGTAFHADRGGDVTAFTYDGDKRVKTRITTTASGTMLSSVLYVYNAAGQATQIYDALSNTVQNAYDNAGQLVERLDQLGRATSTFYDNAGRAYMTVYADGTVSSNTYDSASRLIKVSRFSSDFRLLTSDSYSYDALGRQVAATDALGNTTTSVFDLLGRTVPFSPTGPTRRRRMTCWAT